MVGPFCAGIIAEPLEFSYQDFDPAQAGMEFVRVHWPYPPNPAEYHSPGLGLLVALFAIAVVFIVVVFYAAKSSRPHRHEPEPELDETRSNEKG
jgi:hypothetical protein